MAELVVKKWQLGRVLTAKNTEKAAFYVSKPRSKRITTHR